MQKNKYRVQVGDHYVTLKPKHRWPDFFCAMPAVLILAVMTYYPLGKLIEVSFTDWNLLSADYNYVGFKNWEWLFTAATSKRYLLNTLRVTGLYTLGHVASSLIGGVLLALLFNKMTKSFSAMRAIIFMPRYIAMSTCGIVFCWIFNYNYGVVNQFLTGMGLQAVPWLEDRTMALVTVLIVSFWHGTGYSMMIYLSAMIGISRDYYEAAWLDGANGRQTFRYITLPLLSPTTLFLFITTFISSMKVYQSVDTLTGGGPYNSTEVFVYYIYRLAFTNFRFDRAAVNALFFFVILLAITASTIKITNKNIQYES